MTILWSSLLVVSAVAIWKSSFACKTFETKYDETIKFVLTLVTKEFPDVQVNFVSRNHDIKIINKLSSLIQNPLTISNFQAIQQAHWQAKHQKISWSELNIFFIDSQSDFEIKSLPVPTQINSHLSYNIIVNQMLPSVLQADVFYGLKHKIELIQKDCEVIVQSLCFFCANGQSKLDHVGYLIGQKQLEIVPSKQDLFRDYTQNFYGRLLRVHAGSAFATLNRFALTDNGTYVPTGGFQVPLLLALQEKFNFKMNITLQKAFGKKEADGSYSGLIGKVHSGEAEMGTGAAVTLERYTAVEFMAPNTIQFAVFSTAIPTSRIKWQAVFKSMSLEAWAILLAICVGFILPTYIAVNVVHRTKAGPLTMAYDCFDFLGRTLLEQAGVERQIFPQPSGRFLIVSWLYFSIILGTAYKSRLVSLMISPVNEIVPNTFEELAASDYQIYTHFAGGALSKLIQSTPSATFQKIAKKMTLEKSMVKCIGFSLAPKTACISYRDNLNGEGNKNFTDRNGHILYRKAPGTAFNFPVSIILPKGAVYRDNVNKAVLQLIDTGMALHSLETEIKTSWLQGKLWARSRKDTQLISPVTNYTLKLQHFIGVYLLWASSLSIAVWVFIAEKFGKTAVVGFRNWNKLDASNLSSTHLYIKD